MLTRPAETPLIYELGRINEPTIKVQPHVQTDTLAAKLQLPRVVLRLRSDAPSRGTRLMERVASFWQGEVSRTFRIEAFVEPLPLAENRITLLEERDKLGMRRAKLSLAQTVWSSRPSVKR